MRNNYWYQKTNSKHFHFYKILNSFKRKMVKMQYTSVKQMGQMHIFKEKEEFNA